MAILVVMVASAPPTPENVVEAMGSDPDRFGSHGQAIGTSGSPLLHTDGVDFPDWGIARVCVSLNEAIYDAPPEAGFTLRGIIDYDGGLVEFELPVSELELVMPLSSHKVYVVGYVSINPPPVVPDFAMACAQLFSNGGHAIADGECQYFPYTL